MIDAIFLFLSGKNHPASLSQFNNLRLGEGGRHIVVEVGERGGEFLNICAEVDANIAGPFTTDILVTITKITLEYLSYK